MKFFFKMNYSVNLFDTYHYAKGRFNYAISKKCQLQLQFVIKINYNQFCTLKNPSIT